MDGCRVRRIASFFWIVVLVLAVPACRETARERPEAEPEAAGPRSQPGTEMSIYSPEQHDRYSGRFILGAGRIYQVGTLEDPPGWDHMGNDATNVRPVEGSVQIDVDEVENTGSFVARLTVPEGELLLEIQRFHEFSPCQDGGIAAYIFEHGDSGCGDSNWPKSLLYVAGWGYGRATLNGREPLRGLPDALHGDAGNAGSRDARDRLPYSRQEELRRRGRPRGPTAGLLHQESGKG